METSTDKISTLRKQILEYCIHNRDMIIDFDSLNDEDRDHIYDIAASIVLTRDNILMGGGFVKSVIANDLHLSVGYADSICIRALKLFVNINLYLKIKM